MSKIRFYKYYFNGVDKPVIMEAENRIIADQMMQQLKEKTTVKLSAKNLIDVRVETPIIGISKRKRHNKDYVWVGNIHRFAKLGSLDVFGMLPSLAKLLY